MLKPYAQKRFTAKQLEVLDLWRPGGLNSYARRKLQEIFTFSHGKNGNQRWHSTFGGNDIKEFEQIGREDATLSREKGRIGPAELNRLFADEIAIALMLCDMAFFVDIIQPLERLSQKHWKLFSKVLDAGEVDGVRVGQCYHKFMMARKIPMNIFLEALDWATDTYSRRHDIMIPVFAFFNGFYTLLSLAPGLMATNPAMTEGLFDTNIIKKFPLTKDWEHYAAAQLTVFDDGQSMEDIMNEYSDNSWKVWASLHFQCMGLHNIRFLYHEEPEHYEPEDWDYWDSDLHKTYITEEKGAFNGMLYEKKTVRIYADDGSMVEKEVILGKNKSSYQAWSRLIRFDDFDHDSGSDY